MYSNFFYSSFGSGNFDYVADPLPKDERSASVELSSPSTRQHGDINQKSIIVFYLISTPTNLHT
jgi:hypothetical protein